MIERMQVFKCSVCGNVVEVLYAGGGTLVCCGQEMGLLKENTVDAATEKHVPVVEKTDAGYRVKVGSVAHPMEENHWIQWIELITGDAVHRQHLNPGQAAEATFDITADDVIVRELCNLHGLWKA